jgi:alpha/beta superfamily hydrolase
MKRTFVGSCLSVLTVIIVCIGMPATAQKLDDRLPKAIFVDPPRDDVHPMRNEAVWIPSGGVLMNGVMFAAAGAQPHATAVIFHGTPGNEQNLDLAQTLRRAGLNVLTFHYRGTWGSPGKFTQAGGVDDGQAAMAFLQDPANVSKFHVDVKRLTVIGHSYGGFVAARVAAAHPLIASLILIAPWSPAMDKATLTVPEAQFAATAHSIFDDVEGRMGGYSDVDMAKEILAPGYDWNLESGAAALKDFHLLIIVAKHDSADDQANGLIVALKELHAPNATTMWMDTDHAFSDHRIALQAAVLEWLLTV